jgi:CheY-like chemotaxis protein
MKQPGKKNSSSRKATGRRSVHPGVKPSIRREGETVESSQEGSENLQNTRTKAKRSPTSTAGGGEPIEILLVEDTEYDARRTINALKNGKIRNRVNWVEDGVEAMEFLRRQGAHADAPRPDLILLDWYMPRMHGEEVLEQIKQSPDLKRIPVVIMTSSDQEADVLKAYDLHANCYVTKPVNVNEFIDKVRSIETFWLTIVKLPAA